MKEATTTFPLRLTFDQKKDLIDFAKSDGVDPDEPGKLNAWILKQIGIAVGPLGVRG